MKKQFIDKIVKIEGDYSNHPWDSGGETKYGITKALALSYGYTGDMRNLPKDLAYSIYDAEFYTPMRLDKITALSEKIAYELFDTGVNCGRYTAVLFLQRALNCFNQQGVLWFDIKEDGNLGVKTLKTLETMMSSIAKAESLIMKVLEGLQVNHYVDLVTRRQKDEKSFKGWIANRVGEF